MSKSALLSHVYFIPKSHHVKLEAFSNWRAITFDFASKFLVSIAAEDAAIVKCFHRACPAFAPLVGGRELSSKQAQANSFQSKD
jgi:hypothetical protein